MRILFQRIAEALAGCCQHSRFYDIRSIDIQQRARNDIDYDDSMVSYKSSVADDSYHRIETGKCAVALGVYSWENKSRKYY
jgi:hypothetical protein